MKMRLPDPRCVFALSIYLSVFAVVVRELWLILLLLLVAILFAIALGVNIKSILKRLKRLLQVVVTIAILQSIFAPSGGILLAVGGVTLITYGGVEQGLVVMCRLCILIFSGSLFTLYSLSELVHSMMQLRLPSEIAYMVSVGIRFIPLLSQQFTDSLIALQLRGVVITKMKLAKRLKVYVYLLFPVVASSIADARSLAISMEMRGFRAYQKRSSFYCRKMQKRDYALLCFILFLAVGTSVVNIYTKGV